MIAGCFWLTTNVRAQQVYSTVKDAFFTLTAIVQTDDGGTKTVRVSNRDILAALNATGAFNFKAGARLLLRSVNGGLPYFVVQESNAGQVTTTDVSEYLTLTEPDDAVHGENSLVNWGIWNLTLNGGGRMDFNMWGLTILHTGAIPTGKGGDLLRTVSLSSVGSGPGHLGNANAQFSGKVTANHARIDNS